MAGRVYTAWNPIRNPVNYYLLCGKKSPGIVTMSGLNQPRRIQELMAPGFAGATCVYLGWKPCHFSATHTLLTEEDWLEWMTFKTMLKLPARGQRPKALSFWHPFADMFDPPIRSVLVEDVLQPITNDNGSETIEVKYAQFERPKMQFSKPDAATDQPLTKEQAITKFNELNQNALSNLAGSLRDEP
jgi:hypothetical protein